MKSVPMGFFNSNSLGQVSGVCTTVIGTIETMVPIVMVNILSGLITTAVFAAMILVFDWRIGLIVLAGAALYLCAVSAMEKKSAAIAEDTQRSRTALIEAVLETVQGMSVVKSFNLTGKGDRKLQDALEYNRRSNLEVERVMTPYTAAQEAVLQIAGTAMMLATVLLWRSGAMTPANALMTLVCGRSVGIAGGAGRENTDCFAPPRGSAGKDGRELGAGPLPPARKKRCGRNGKLQTARPSFDRERRRRRKRAKGRGSARPWPEESASGNSREAQAGPARVGAGSGKRVDESGRGIRLGPFGGKRRRE